MIQELISFLTVNWWLAAVAAGLLLLAALLLFFRAAARRRAGRQSPAAPGASAAIAVHSLQLVGAGGTVYALRELPATLGRAPENTIVLRDPAVSAAHARIVVDEALQAVCVEDCDSTNGLYVDDQPTRKNVLRDNARITLGATTLTFRNGGYVLPAQQGTSQGTRS